MDHLVSCGIDPYIPTIASCSHVSRSASIVASLSVTFEWVQKMIAGNKYEGSEAGRWVAYMWDHSMLDSLV